MKALTKTFRMIDNLARFADDDVIMTSYSSFMKFFNGNLCMCWKATELLNLVHLAAVIPTLKKKN